MHVHDTGFDQAWDEDLWGGASPVDGLQETEAGEGSVVFG